MNITDQFVNRICSIRYEEISKAALDKLRVCLVDTLGVTVAGAHDLRCKETSLMKLMGNEETISPIGYSKKTSLMNAIFINGLSAHFLELDDGVRYGVIHPSAPLFSALIPIAICNDVDWEHFVLGSICGYETSIRLASAMQPYHYSEGFHPTATCCTVGVAVATAIMLGFDKEVVKDALSAATISSYGTLKVLENTSQLKPYNCAKAALNGYISVLMAKAGFKGPEDALSGDTGFLKMMSPHYDENILLGANDFLYVEKVYLKPYASCRHTHPEIEAAFRIRKEKGFNLYEVKSIEVRTYKGVIGKHDSNEIYGESSARMSIPFSIATALANGKAGIEEFAEPFVNDKTILNLTKLVHIEGDEELSKLVPDKRVAIVSLLQKDGNHYSARVEYPKGEPENPLTETELFDKFFSMMQHGGVPENTSRRVFNEIINNDSIKLKDLQLI